MPHYITLEQARSKLSNAQRVSVIGCSGGGKSTLSLKISKQFKLRYISIDKEVRWLPGWVVRDRAEQRTIWQDMVQGQHWVMDGTSPSSFDIRLPRTQLVLWVRVPRYQSLMGLCKRVLRYHGQVRPDMAEGCKEQMPDLEFLSYIWNFEKQTSPQVIEGLDTHGPDVPVLVLRSHREMTQLLENMPTHSAKAE